MKVYLGPYPTFFGPYQLAELLRYIGVSEERYEKIADYLNEQKWLVALLEWIDRRFRQRKVRVVLHKHDTWNIVDGTLAPIMVPLLRQYKATMHGAPDTDDNDVPEHLRSTAAPPLTEEEKKYGASDKLFFDRWNWIVDEMLWAFEQMNNQNHDDQFFEHPADSLNDISKIKIDHEGLLAHNERINRGLLLFGKYLRGLWD